MIKRLLGASIVSVCLFVFSGAVFADMGGYGYNYSSYQFQMQKAPPKNDSLEFARDGKSYYAYAGYVFSYHFNDKFITFDDALTEFTIALDGKKALPDQFHGIEVGMGKQLSKHFDLRASYIQQFIEKRNGTISQEGVNVASLSKVSMKGMSVNLLYFFNTIARFQFGAEIGASIMHVSDIVETSGFTYNLPDNNTTEVDPNLGLELVVHFTPSIALRLNEKYIWHSGSEVSSGELNTLVGLSYALFTSNN